MTGSYTADLDLAAWVLASLGRVEEQLDEVVTDLRWRVEHLQVLWAGRAAAAHLEAHQRWLAAYGEMRTALAEMRHALDTARANYEEAARANTTLWRSVR